MSETEVRPLSPGDFDALMELEHRMFGSRGEKTLGPYYIRLCCDFFGDTCFLALSDGEPVGYLLAFVRGREAHCSTLAIVPEHQGTRAVYYLVQALIRAIAYRVDTLWFTVHEDNEAARALHATLGAREQRRSDAYFGPGEPRILSRIDRQAFDRLRARLERVGLLERPPLEVA